MNKNIATFEDKIQNKIDLKTKPLGSLGHLESLAKQICLVQQTLTPSLINPHMVVFAGDHGIAQSGVSAYPSEVTSQMVLNFLDGGAAINVFCKQNNIELKIADAGVHYDFPKHASLIHSKIGYGTKNFLNQNAMSSLELERCFSQATKIIDEIASTGCNIIGFGEMGIGNTSSAAMLMSSLCHIPLEECVGRGTGLGIEQVRHKLQILKQAQNQHEVPKDAYEALCYFGGFEIAQICGAMLESYKHNMLIMVDGFIATAAFLCAYSIQKKIVENAIFCHQSDEYGHVKMLDFIGATPLLKLNLRLGEGTGCAITYPIITSAVNFMNEMTSFESANVSTKKK